MADRRVGVEKPAPVEAVTKPGPDVAMGWHPMLSHTPWNILSSTVGVGILTDGWTLADLVFEPDEARSFIVEVVFDTAFSATPVVQLGLSGFDLDQRESGRISLKTGAITRFGFQAVICSWSTSRVYAVEFNWLAVGA